MIIKGQQIKASIVPENTAKQNKQLSRIGSFDQSAVNLIENLNELFKSNPTDSAEIVWATLREAMTDEQIPEPQLPLPGTFEKKEIGAIYEKFLHQKRARKIRLAICEFLIRIQKRDAKFFNGLAACLDKGTKHIVADELRFRLSQLRAFQECGYPKMTFAELDKKLIQLMPDIMQDGKGHWHTFDRTTIERACKEVGLALKPDKRGRPATGKISKTQPR